MAPPPVSIYVTSLTSQPKVRQNIELLRRSLRALEIPYTEHDLVMDEEAKTRWQRAKPTGQIIGLPGYLVGGEWVGTMEDFEYAAESGTLPSFLKQDTELAANTSIGEAELERLMREMSDSDLDALAAEVGKGSGDTGGIGKIGLMTPSGALPVGSSREKEVIELSGEGRIGSGSAAERSDRDEGSSGLNPGESKSTDSIKGISSAAQQTVETITSKASSLTSSLGGPEPHSGTADTPSVRSPTSPSISTSSSKVPTISNTDSAVADTPTSGRSPTFPQHTPTSPIGAIMANAKNRRLSKEEIAAEMMKADSVEGLLASLHMAEGKEKRD